MADDRDQKNDCGCALMLIVILLSLILMRILF